MKTAREQVFHAMLSLGITDWAARELCKKTSKTRLVEVLHYSYSDPTIKSRPAYVVSALRYNWKIKPPMTDFQAQGLWEQYFGQREPGSEG